MFGFFYQRPHDRDNRASHGFFFVLLFFVFNPCPGHYFHPVDFLNGPLFDYSISRGWGGGGGVGAGGGGCTKSVQVALFLLDVSPNLPEEFPGVSTHMDLNCGTRRSRRRDVLHSS